MLIGSTVKSSADGISSASGRARRCGALDVLVAKHASDRERLMRREMSRALRKRAKNKPEDIVVPRSRIGGCQSAAA
jgi:hypothetical protein